jgi:manganese-dependent ADP-ribose/CDP-alcohol diphosphatase
VKHEGTREEKETSNYTMSRISSLLIFSLVTLLPLAGPVVEGASDKTTGKDRPIGARARTAKPLFEFGAVADCQYCDADSKRRRYKLSPEKLRKCVEEFNKQQLSHVVHLGDFIDRDWKSYDVVLPIMDKLKAPVRFVLGNHDFSVADEFKNKVPGRLGLSSRYYDFSVGKWRFLVLDSNDISLYAYPAGSVRARKSREIHQDLGGDLPDYNGGIGDAQLAWLNEQLIKAENNGESVVVHAHHPVYPVSRSHNVWNDAEVVALLEKHASVVAYINGHNHNGAYGFKKGIHYLTMKGMVDTEETSYAVIRVFDDRLEVHGRGRQDNYVLEISGKATSREE